MAFPHYAFSASDQDVRMLQTDDFKGEKKTDHVDCKTRADGKRLAAFWVSASEWFLRHQHLTMYVYLYKAAATKSSHSPARVSAYEPPKAQPH